MPGLILVAAPLRKSRGDPSSDKIPGRAGEKEERTDLFTCRRSTTGSLLMLSLSWEIFLTASCERLASPLKTLLISKSQLKCQHPRNAPHHPLYKCNA